MSVSAETLPSAGNFLFSSNFSLIGMFLGIILWAAVCSHQPITAQGKDYKNIATKLPRFLVSLLKSNTIQHFGTLVQGCAEVWACLFELLNLKCFKSVMFLLSDSGFVLGNTTPSLLSLSCLLEHYCSLTLVEPGRRGQDVHVAGAGYNF